jgi:hypothetical protein
MVRSVKRFRFVVPSNVRMATGVILGVAFLVIAFVAPLLTEASTHSAKRTNAPDASASRAGFDLREHLSEATVRYGEHECKRWTGNRWDCDLEPWLWVGKHQGRVSTPTGPEWRPCIWAHAEAHNGRAVPLSITWNDLQWVGSLTGEVAILDTPVPGGSAQFRVLIDGKQRTSVRVSNAANRRDHERRWKPWSVGEKSPGNSLHEVTIEITASDGSWRQVCFSARMGPEAL